VFGTRDGKVYIYACNGHGAWEAALTNVLSRGDKVLVLVSGLVSRGVGRERRKLGLDVEELPEREGRAIDAAAVRERLNRDSAHEFKAVLMVHADTATGVVNDIAAVRSAMDEAGHPALLMVDTIASLGSIPFSMDELGVDVAVGGAQKGLMTPPAWPSPASAPGQSRHTPVRVLSPATGTGRSATARNITCGLPEPRRYR
jgi:alanine-glyoxylate transaminase/serine-glyoxylate transaminase/serine-pyruvate transaminase